MGEDNLARPERLPALENVSRFFETIYKDRSCQFCSGEEFTIVMSEDMDNPERSDPAIVTIPSYKGNKIAGYITVVLMICVTCGHTDVFDLEKIAEWLEKHP